MYFILCFIPFCRVWKNDDNIYFQEKVELASSEKVTVKVVFRHWIFVETYWHCILRCVHLVILQKKMFASEWCTHLKYTCITDACVSAIGVSSIDWPLHVCAKVTGQVTLEMLWIYRRRKHQCVSIVTLPVTVKHVHSRTAHWRWRPILHILPISHILQIILFFRTFWSSQASSWCTSCAATSCFCATPGSSWAPIQLLRLSSPNWRQ